MKKIIIAAILLIFPFGILAKEDWKMLESGNNLKIEGKCAGDGSVRIDLFSAKDPQKAAYTSGAWCQKGKFQFSDNISQWKSLQEQEYDLVVDGDKKNSQKFFLNRAEQPISFTEETLEETDEETNAVSAETVSLEIDGVVGEENEMPSGNAPSPETKFLTAFLGVQQSILDMRVYLAGTGYPTLAKESLDTALDILELAVGKVSDLVISSESSPAPAADDSAVGPATAAVLPAEPVAE